MTPIMSEKLAPRGKISSATCFGLFLSLFGMILTRQAVSYFSPTLPLTTALWKESLVWLRSAKASFLIRFLNSTLNVRRLLAKTFGVESFFACLINLVTRYFSRSCVFRA
jgi:hypothetical protein